MVQNPYARVIKVKELDSYLEQVKKEKIQREMEALGRNYQVDEQKQKEFFKLRMNGESVSEAIAKLQIPKKQAAKQDINTPSRRIKTIY